MTELILDTDDARWAAAQRRDPAADGRFFIAVGTTGVYCRPICPGRPLRKNVEFFGAAQDCRRAGYRACKRCNPDQAPSS